MTRITVDSELRNKLLDLSEPLDFYDESGRIIGMFVPISAAAPPGYREPPLSDEEWARRQQEPGFTTDELFCSIETAVKFRLEWKQTATDELVCHVG